MRALHYGLAVLAAMAASAPVAEAQRKSAGSVTACSHYGKGCITAPVRRGRVETEVRMPGGTWIGCKLDCRETLREEAIDFFETLRDRAPDGWR